LGAGKKLGAKRWVVEGERLSEEKANADEK